MKLRRRWLKHGLCVLLVFFLLFQLNALPIHEYNLRQQGYTLIHVERWNLGTLPQKMIFKSNGKEYYNTALCTTHFRIHLLKQFHEVAFLLLVSLGMRVGYSFLVPDSSTLQKDEFLACLTCRAPPVAS